MNLEMGGGVKPRGDGWTNMDMVAGADIVHDLDQMPWPLADDSVEQFYSSHCLEHLKDPLAVLNEVVRIGKLGCPVEIRVPHPNSDLAMVAGHLHVFSPIAALNMENHFPGEFWHRPKRLKLVNIEYGPSIFLEQAKKELPFLRGVDDRIIMRWIQGTCHEVRFYYQVVENEHLKERP